MALRMLTIYYLLNRLWSLKLVSAAKNRTDAWLVVIV